MNGIKNFKIGPLVEPKFVKPVKIYYEEYGVKKEWEAIRSHDSVAILLYHTEKNAFLIVKQFRPPVYLNNQEHGITYELCAGILDKNIDNISIAQEEIIEECGYNVPLSKIEKVTSFYTSVGVAGAHQTVYYAAIDESMLDNEGGGVESENIELYFLPIDHSKKFIFDEAKPKTPGLMFAFYWYFDNKM